MSNITAAAGAATAASSSYGTGLYANAGVSYDSTTEFTDQNDTVYTGSEVLAGGDVEFNAGKDMTQSGSMVGSLGGDVTYNIDNDLRLDASRNSFAYESGSESEHAAVTIGSNAFQADYSESKSSNRSSDHYYSNSGTYATEGDITYNVGNDMTGAGYNAEGKNIIANVGDDMILNSMQNAGDSKNSSSSFGVGIGTGNISGNIGSSKGSGKYQQTEISSLIGAESVDVNVDGKLSMSGSVIANLDTEGRDLGNLNINAGSFESENLRDFSENEQSGFNVGVSTGNPIGENSTPSGSSTIGMTDTGHKTEGTTYATVGEGTITVADNSDISDLNRDTTNIQETTSDKVTGALDGSVTVDHRVLTPDGWSKTIVRQKDKYGAEVYDKNEQPIFEKDQVGIIADFKDAGDTLSHLVPTVGSDWIKDEFGLVPHGTIVEGQDLGELKVEETKNEKGEVVKKYYYEIDPNMPVSIYGQQVTYQNGIEKLADGNRLYVEPQYIGNMDAFFRDTGGFGMIANNNIWGMSGTSQIHDVLMQRKAELRQNNPNYNNKELGLGELIDTGIMTYFLNGYYSIGTWYRMRQGNEAYNDQYEKQTGSNVMQRGQ